MEMKAVTVSQLNEYIGRVLSDDPLLSGVRVRGELTSVKYHSTGHIYFTISDAGSRLSCFLMSDRAGLLKMPLNEGDLVTLSGYIRVYQRGGYYSLNVRDVEYEGEGEISAAFERLKAKLSKEGLFDSAHKKSIPPAPRTVGLVTSGTGAAVRDMIKIITSRTVLTDIVVFPVAVQGISAPGEITEMINFLDAEWFGRLDTIIVGRGGGDPEELQAFSDENVARAIYDCRIPVISAVGHEIDFSISDFVADARAETPTAAAQMAVPDDSVTLAEAEDMLTDIESRMSSVLMCEMLHAKSIYNEILHITEAHIDREISSANLMISSIRARDPRAILEQGYAAVTDTFGRPVRSAEEVLKGEKIHIILKDGRLCAAVEEVTK